MGKRTTGFSGLSRFLQAEKLTSDLPVDVRNGTKRSLDSSAESQSSKKKRKSDGESTEDIGTSRTKLVQKYDMSGSIPVFKTMQEVPENLKKCEYVLLKSLFLFNNSLHRLRSTGTILFAILYASGLFTR